MDYDHDARYAKRAELTRQGGPEAFLRKGGVHRHFASHSALSFTDVQVLRPKTQEGAERGAAVRNACSEVWLRHARRLLREGTAMTHA